MVMNTTVSMIQEKWLESYHAMHFLPEITNRRQLCENGMGSDMLAPECRQQAGSAEEHASCVMRVCSSTLLADYYTCYL
jgi:hypothetical protein